MASGLDGSEFLSTCRHAPLAVSISSPLPGLNRWQGEVLNL